MAHIVIRDLSENVELDREAMRKITGGSATTRTATFRIESGQFRNPLNLSGLKLLPEHPGLPRQAW